MGNNLRGKPGRASKQASTGERGLVVAAHGRHYLVERHGGSFLQCFPRGKRSECAVGDHVVYEATAIDQGVVLRVDERRNLLHRSDQFKSKMLAANLEQIVIMLGTEPSFSEDLLGRALVAAESLGITPLILLNKIDLTARLETARSRLALYRELGYTIVELTVHGAPEAAHAALEPHVAGRASILIGQSGMGKSSLLNLLIPGVDAQTREISEKLDSGKHTTTFTRLYHLPAAWGRGGVLIDSPGFQEFGLHHLSEGMLERAFPEFRPRLTECRFYNCRHLQEPGCGILNAMAEGKIDPRRHQLYAQLLHESEQQKPW